VVALPNQSNCPATNFETVFDQMECANDNSHGARLSLQANCDWWSAKFK
jgi:hypothetical protein